MNDEPLTMSVAEYVAASGVSEYSVREDIRLGRIPVIKVGKRGLVRILRRPAMARLLGALLGVPT
jgi:hypothetical protein